MYVWQVLLDLFQEMGLISQVGEASGGSTTTVVDSTLALDTNVKTGGSIIIQKTTDGLAPQGEIKRVASNTSNTYTTAAFSAAVGAGDEYAYIAKDFNVYEFLRLVNMGLKKVGRIPIVDVSITTADNQREYTLPTAIKSGLIRAVYLQKNTGDADDNRWAPMYDWSTKWSVAGSTALLVFKKQPEAGYTVRIDYVGLHPDITAYSDTINEAIHPELIKAALKYQLNQSRNEEAIASQDGYRDLYGASRDEFNEALRRFPIYKGEIIRPALTFKRS